MDGMATKQKRITFKLPDVEYERIQALSERTGRTMTDILREFIRTLPEPEPEPKSESEKKSQKK
jgi:predicted DNA-binding protein